MDAEEVWMITVPSAMLVICDSSKKYVVLFLLTKAHFYPCSLQVCSSLRIAWDIQIGPGMMGENITVEGIAVMELAAGTRLQIGPALVEVTEIRNPCYQLNGIDRRLLKAVVTKEQGKTRFKAGIMARILQGGWVRPGDQITLCYPKYP